MTKTTTTTKTLLAMIVMSAGMTALTLPADARPMNTPAHAQQNNRASAQLDARIQNLKSELNNGQRSGRISRKEASRLSGKVDAIVSLKRSYERSGRGLTTSEVATLNARINTLSGQIHVQAKDHNRR